MYFRDKVYIRRPQCLYSVGCCHGRALPPNKGILAGNSVWQDRRFLKKYMPKIELPLKENFVTYHNIDSAYDKMEKLLSIYEFTSFEKYLEK